MCHPRSRLTFPPCRFTLQVYATLVAIAHLLPYPPSCPLSLRPSDSVRKALRHQVQRLTLNFSGCSCTATHRPSIRRMRSSSVPSVVFERQATKSGTVCCIFQLLGGHWLLVATNSPREQSCSLLRNILHNKWDVHGHRGDHCMVYVSRTFVPVDRTDITI